MEPDTILAIVVICYSIVLHEIAHGYAALRFGDPTARDLGRLSLNPISHIDPVGTVLFPILQIALMGHFFIGWAKPVPVDVARLRPRVAGEVVVSLAGIAANFTIALLLAVALGSETFAPAGRPIVKALYLAMAANVALGCFNLLPIPPLDGSHVFKYLLPVELRRGYQQLGFYGILILLVLIQSGSLDAVLWAPVELLVSKLVALAELLRGGPLG